MPESPGLYLRLTVAENLQCFAGLYELDDVRGRIERALRAVNLLDRAGDPCGSLSKGLRQRVALARALLNDPAVLFLDEPGVAILNTTLRLIGRPDELRARLFTKSLDVRIRAPLADPAAVFGALREVEGWEQAPSASAGGYTLAVADPEIAAPAVARALVGADADILSIAESRHSLEDVYLELIDEDVEASRR